MSDTYITTTGERWVAGDSFGLCVADTDNLMPNAITSTRLLAELHALRAQRDELLAALTALWQTYGWRSDITDAELREVTDGGAMVAARRAIARATGKQEAQR